VVLEHEGKRITAAEIISNSLCMGIWIIFDNPAELKIRTLPGLPGEISNKNS
jgi:hypothetical protein